jgi:hypothetical protein
MTTGDYNLPEYLGIGILDRYSVVRTETGVYATYSTCDGELIYAIDWTNERCIIEEFWYGKELSMGVADDLNEAFFIHQMASKRVRWLGIRYLN